jgi:catechol 2,3-dioxygenase-like lactoylglutathione lyase family enzyme
MLDVGPYQAEGGLMLDHIQIDVRDLERSIAFYKVVLAPLGYELVFEVDGSAGFGVDGGIDFCLQSAKRAVQGVHVAFRSEDRAKVRAFHEAALKAGGKDNGPPGIREHYHPNYYGAFVIDINGHNIEAVCHNPE